jgi:hypothetical protein|tara:strand:+ start:1097 stop:1264 length:168 start_codon:yes stop_codon:yes gene_type:complete
MSKEMVDALSNGDNVGAETEFNSALSLKLGDALETKRKELAGTFVSTMSVKNEQD